MKNTFLLSITLFVVIPVFATVRYVKPIASGSGNGSDWANASNNIQAMIQASAVGDEVWVASGDYKPNTYPYNGASQYPFSNSRKYCFHLKNGVKLYGGFAGNETSIAQRNLLVNVTTLNGDIGIQGDNSDNCYHVMLVGSAAIVDGFTVKNGNANGTEQYILPSSFGVWIYDNDGGGMYVSGSNTMITNCKITENRADRYGGGAKTMGGTNYYNSVFSLNTCISNGGAAYVESVSLDTIRFSKTIFVSDTAARGGGIFVEEGLIRIDSSDFSLNLGTVPSGGGSGASLHFVHNINVSVITNSSFYDHQSTESVPVFSINHKLNLTNNLFENNITSSAVRIAQGRGNLYNNTFRNNSGAGFALSHETFVSTVSNNLFDGNGASALDLYNANSIVEKNVIINNYNSYAGGGAYLNGFDGIIRQNLFKGNSTYQYGGAIFNSSGSSLISGNTFIENDAFLQTGTVIASNAGEDTIANNILFGAVPITPTGKVIYSTIAQNQQVVIGNNLIGDANDYNATQFLDNNFLNPGFVDVNDFDGADNIYGTADDGFALSECSPLIDIAISDYVSGNVDLIGGSKPVIGSDLGAIESDFSNNYPLSFSITGASSFCPGTDSMDITINGSEIGNIYELVINGVIIDSLIGTGDTLVFTALASTGVINIQSTNLMGCQRFMLDSMVVSLYPTPFVQAQANPSTICPGSFSNLSATGAISYAWSDVTSVSPDTTSYYSVIGIDVNGCSDTTGVWVNVIEVDLPVINFEDGILSVPAQYSWYNWYDCLNNQAIPDAIGNTYIPLQNGEYAIHVSQNGCELVSDCFVVSDLGVTSVQNNYWEIYPNPSKDQVTIKGATGTKSQVSVTDLSGKTLLVQSLETNTVDISALPKGMYVLTLTSEFGTQTQKLVKH